MTTTVMKFSIIFFLLLGMTLMMCEAQQVEDRLETDLLYTYYKSNLPSYVEGLDVDIGMSLRSLKRLDFENGAVIMNAEIRMVWRDYRLMWYPTEYGNLTGLPIRSSDIWIPDITLYNSILPRTSLPEKLAVVHYTGKICYEPRMRLAVNCTLDQEDDIQNCSLKWGSWAYDSEMLSVSPSSDEIDLSNYRENPDWEIVSTTAEKQTVTYACCPNVYEDIVFSLAIRRRETPGESSGEGSGVDGPGTTSAAASTVSD